MIFVVLTVHLLFIFVWPVTEFREALTVLEFLNNLWGARNRVGIGLSYRPARLHRLTKLISWNRFLGYLKVSKLGLWRQRMRLRIKPQARSSMYVGVGLEVNFKKWLSSGPDMMESGLRGGGGVVGIFQKRSFSLFCKLVQKHCSGSASACFWASRIRIRIRSSEVRIRGYFFFFNYLLSPKRRTCIF